MNTKTLLLTAALLTVTQTPAQSGDVTVHFNQIEAYYFNGTTDKNLTDNNRCRSMYTASPIEKPMTFHYDINPATSYQTGHALYDSKAVTMYPEGIKNNYAFMSDDVSSLSDLHILRITTSIDTRFQHIISHIMMNGGTNFNCVISGSNNLP